MATTTQDAIQEMEAERANWLVIAEDFTTPEEAVKDATEKAAELYTKLTAAKAALARGELFVADGVQQEIQYADENGAKYVANGTGIMEPDCTSPDMGEGDHKPSKKPSRKRGATKRQKQSDRFETTTDGRTPGYYRKVMPDGSFITMVGPSPPPGGYPSEPYYSGVILSESTALDISDEFVRQAWLECSKYLDPNDRDRPDWRVRAQDLLLHVIHLIGYGRTRYCDDKPDTSEDSK